LRLLPTCHAILYIPKPCCCRSSTAYSGRSACFASSDQAPLNASSQRPPLLPCEHFLVVPLDSSAEPVALAQGQDRFQKRLRSLSEGEAAALAIQQLLESVSEIGHEVIAVGYLDRF
jgi:hypothetical protein